MRASGCKRVFASEYGFAPGIFPLHCKVFTSRPISHSVSCSSSLPFSSEKPSAAACSNRSQTSSSEKRRSRSKCSPAGRCSGRSRCLQRFITSAIFCRSTLRPRPEFETRKHQLHRIRGAASVTPEQRINARCRHDVRHRERESSRRLRCPCPVVNVDSVERQSAGSSRGSRADEVTASCLLLHENLQQIAGARQNHPPPLEVSIRENLQLSRRLHRVQIGR